VRAPYASDEERVQDMLVFMTAGHGTTAGTLTLALMDLAQDPDTLARVQVCTRHEEASLAPGSVEETPTFPCPRGFLEPPGAAE
jgi:cytochrome P450